MFGRPKLSEEPALRATLPLVSGRLDVAEAACYYSGNCILAPYTGLRGDPYFNVDARLAKNLKLGEHRNLQFIFQAFNLFNHANYGNSFDSLVATLSTDKQSAALELRLRQPA